jgi:hypothetical protein
MSDQLKNEESKRLEACGSKINKSAGSALRWKKWGPYLSERQWGTVREDYSENGDVWNYFTHDQARARAYRWGEDGLGGICDDHQLLCFSIALWNGKDPILKERLFGLTNTEGNHGEDVKEYYFYLDSTPTHSYMKFLYKYPQVAYPYEDLVKTNHHRSRGEDEYELLDTGIFDDDRYFDIFIEYAKADPEDILIRITVINRGPEEAQIDILPNIWFRNTWSWEGGGSVPVLRSLDTETHSSISASHTDPHFIELISEYILACEGKPELLFTNNESNNQLLFGTANKSPYVKDGINNYLIKGKREAINPAKTGTRAAAHYHLIIPGGESAEIRLRFFASGDKQIKDPFGNKFDTLFETRIREADEFYQSLILLPANKDEENLMRQALAGMLWTKQYYYFDAHQWLLEHRANPLLGQEREYRNRDWYHMLNNHVISMPDKWEYPWYAAWDLAFHAIALSVVDTDFAKEQLDLMLKEVYLHPSGQIPAYEWNFSDVNPPVHAWATLFLYRAEQVLHGKVDIGFLKRSFSKLMLNFAWWVNRKDRFGKNVFEGGFLGMDNIGVFDRSAPLPTGGNLEQADGTGWMALFCQNMIELSIELASTDPVYEDLCYKFVEHFLWIASGMNHIGRDGMWDEEDGFYYDLIRFPDGSYQRLKVRSLVGLLPLCATTVIEDSQKQQVPGVLSKWRLRLTQMPELHGTIHDTTQPGFANRTILSLVSQDRMRRILTRMLDENEFLSPYGIRSLSKYHLEQPYVFDFHGSRYSVGYLAGESDSGMFGGNSNWWGPIWVPINVIIIRALLSYYLYYGDNFRIEFPTGSGRMMNLFEVSREIARRLIRIFLKDDNGKRPVYGSNEKFQSDPYWQDHILFYEYFNGDSGKGLGASHQTGWTGLVAKLIELFDNLDPSGYLKSGNSLLGED